MLSQLYQMGEDQRLYIPYRAGTGSHTSNIGFIDLKAQPERLCEIHELQGYPEFEELLRTLNSAECSLRTLRVDTSDDDFPEFGHSHTCFSMLSFCFEALGQDEDKRYFVELYNYFRRSASGYLPGDDVRVDFFLIPLTLVSIGYHGWALEIRLYGFGISVESSRNAWARGFERVNK